MTRLAVEFEWEEEGPVRLDEEGQLLFPELPPDPGLYRFWVEGAEERPSVYFGEAADLRRRMWGYRRPGAKQPTNRRLNSILKAVLDAGGRVTVSSVTEVRVTLDGEAPRKLPLDRRYARVVGEQGAILAAVSEYPSTESEQPPVRVRLLGRPGVGEPEYE